MNIWDNIGNYKPCRKKEYDIYVCMPPKGVVVFNNLEQNNSVRALGGRTYFSLADLERAKKINQALYNNVVQLVKSGQGYYVSDKTPFVLMGTLGELWCTAPDKLAQRYSFVSNGQLVQINQASLNTRLKNGILDWTLVRSIPDGSRAYACHVPTKYKGSINTSWGEVLGINTSMVAHGKGDFVIMSALPNGQPNPKDRCVVNGDIFATTYDNRGWEGCISFRGKSVDKNIADAPNLFTI